VSSGTQLFLIREKADNIYMICLLRITASLAVLSTLVACAPRFNREKLKALLPVKTVIGKKSNLLPLVDLTAQGGSAATGNTSHFKVSRVAIAGNIQRIQATTASGKSVQGGPAAPH
jgi:hypothetical protein